jgi:hypothetical protein
MACHVRLHVSIAVLPAVQTTCVLLAANRKLRNTSGVLACIMLKCGYLLTPHMTMFIIILHLPLAPGAHGMAAVLISVASTRNARPAWPWRETSDHG